jgi:hypothetical protein
MIMGGFPARVSGRLSAVKWGRVDSEPARATVDLETQIIEVQRPRCLSVLARSLIRPGDHQPLALSEG